MDLCGKVRYENDPLNDQSGEENGHVMVDDYAWKHILRRLDHAHDGACVLVLLPISHLGGDGHGDIVSPFSRLCQCDGDTWASVVVQKDTAQVRARP